MRNERSLSPAFLAVIHWIVAAMLVVACGVASLPVSQPTATVAPTSTPTVAPSPTKTATPQPTDTSTPTVVPTPASLGDSVPYRSLTITLVKATTHDLIVPGGLYYYRPKDRKDIFLDLGVLVQNSQPGKSVSVQWKDVRVLQEDGTFSYPGFADVETKEPGTDFDPFKIGIATPALGAGMVEFTKDTYLRLIFVIGKKQTVLFTIEDSPQIAFASP